MSRSHRTTTRKLAPAAAAASILTLLALGGCAGHGTYTKEHLSLAQQRMSEMKAGTEWEMARQQFLAGDLDKAIKSVNTSISINDKVPKSHLLRGRILMEQGRLEEARNSFVKTLELNPEFTEAHYFLGIVYERFARPELALEQYMKAIEQDSSNAQFVVAAAEMMMAQGYLDQAVELLETQQNTLQYSAALRQTLGHAKLLQGKPLDAVQLFEQASLLSPDDPLILEDLISAQIEAGQFANAEFNINRLMVYPDYAERRDIMRLRAQCLMQMDRLLEARTILLTLTTNPGGEKDVQTWIDLGTVCYALDERQRLRNTATRVISMAPERHEGYLLRAMFLFREGQLEAALPIADRACELSKDDPTPFILLAMIQQDRGRFNAAVDSLNYALAMDPDNVSAQRLLMGIQRNASFAGVETNP